MGFTVYPKEGEPFKVRLLGRLVFTADDLKVFNDQNAETRYSYLSMKNIAAIVPDNPGRADDSILFHVYLRGRETPLEVSAHAFKTTEPPSVRFYWKFQGRDEEIRNTYVALSEVVAVVPADPSAVIW